MKLVFNGGQSTEYEVAGVGDHGTAARSDAVLGKEFQEIGEELVDASGGGEFFDVGGEFLVEVERGVGGWL
ncbi:MAG: hypothetical protein WA871_12055 [Candidatus Acidiferrales bacterium]